MKLYLYLFLSLFTSVNLIAQQNLKLIIDWDNTSQKYDVSIISPVNQNNLVLGQSKISVVLPNSAPASKLNVVSFAGGNWEDLQTIHKPASAPSSQFHLLSSNGGKIDLLANQEKLLFSFTISDGSCKDGVRLYNNGSDPGKGANGFLNLDFNNSLLTENGNSELYSSNISNSGTKCLDCPVDFSLPKLRKLN